MSILAINWALKQPVPSSSAKFVLTVLANCCDAQGYAYPSSQHLIDATAQDRKTILQNLSKLKTLGLIQDTGQRCGRTGQVKVWQLVGFLGSETNPKTASLNDPKIGNVSDADSVQLNALTVPNKAPLNNTEIGTLYDITVPNMELLNSAENGTVPKTEQYQFSAETVPFFPANSTVFPPKESQKRDTDKSGTIKEPKDKPSTRVHDESIELPSWMPKFAWDDFLNHRKSLGGKKRFTKRGQELALKKLNQLRNEGSDPQMVVEQSIANGWTGLFPIRDKKTQPGSRDGNDDWMRGLL